MQEHNINDKTIIESIINVLDFCKKMKIEIAVIDKDGIRGHLDSILTYQSDSIKDFLPDGTIMIINNIARMSDRLKMLIKNESFNVKLNIAGNSVISVDMTSDEYSMITDCGSPALANRVPKCIYQETCAVLDFTSAKESIKDAIRSFKNERDMISIAIKGDKAEVTVNDSTSGKFSTTLKVYENEIGSNKVKFNFSLSSVSNLLTMTDIAEITKAEILKFVVEDKHEVYVYKRLER